MNISLILRTVSYLRIQQVWYQLRYRIFKTRYKHIKSPIYTDREKEFFMINPIEKPLILSGNNFSFLNLTSEFFSWNDTSKGMLWAYNLNYMDWPGQKDMSYEEGKGWIDRFIDGIPSNRVGLDPYPIALRSINWIKFISKNRDVIPQEKLNRWNDSLYSQCKLLERKLEYHLLGNHLLEDAYALFIASIYFGDKEMYRRSERLLLSELEEQVLPDGAHYEQSPMYHCILLDRLLDCYNVSVHNIIFDGQEIVNVHLKEYAEKMLGHLQSISYSGSEIPLLNDSANGIAPIPTQIYDYARRLNLCWEQIPMKECGYRKIIQGDIEALVDVGNITATYQPGHSHSDTFGYELRVKGKPFVIDTGISTYNKTSRRQYERSTAAHNTVTISDVESNEVWGGFRVGRRARVVLHQDSDTQIQASHNGFGSKRVHCRTFNVENDTFIVEDEVSTSHIAKSYIHLSPSVEIISISDGVVQTNIANVMVSGDCSIEIIDSKVSKEYNTFEDNKTIVITFKGKIKYSIS